MQKLDLKHDDLSNLISQGENVLDVFYKYVKEFLDDNYAIEVMHKDEIIINLDKLCLDLPYEFLLEENINHNWNTFHTILRNIVFSWNDKIKAVYFSLNQQNSIIPIKYHSVVNHDNFKKLYRFVGEVEYILDVQMEVIDWVYKCPFCESIVKKKQKVKGFTCQDTNCRKKYGISNMNLIDKVMVSKKYFLMNCETSQVTSSSIKCYFEIDKDRKNFIFNELLEGRKVELLCEPEIVYDGKDKFLFNYKLIGIMDYKSQKFTQEEINEVKDLILLDYEDYGVQTYTELAHSMSKNVYAHEHLRECVFASFVGLDKEDKQLKDKNKGFHIMLWGNASVGKTFTTRSIANFFDNTDYIQGSSTSGVGLLGGVEKVEGFGYVIKSGSMSKCNNGTIILDEVDKMHPDDVNSLFTAMSEGTHKINKIKKKTFTYNTNIILMANPKSGEFNLKIDFMSQMTLPPSFLSRVDVLAIVNDPVKNNFGKINEDLFKEYMKFYNKRKAYNGRFDEKTLKKYAVAVKTHPNPIITEEVYDLIEQFYQNAYFKQKEFEHNTDFISGAEKSVKKIDNRFMNSVNKLSKIIARALFQKEVKPEHFFKAVDIMQKTMVESMFDKFGTSDIYKVQQEFIDKQECKPISSDREAMTLLLKFIIKKQKENNGKPIDFAELVVFAEKNKIHEFDLDSHLAKLCKEGEIFAPNNNTYRKL